MRSLLPAAVILWMVTLPTNAPAADSVYPAGPTPAPLTAEHFPDRLHTFVFRNWGLVPAARLAKVLQTSERNVRDVAVSLGLPEQPTVPPEMLSRGYITLLRRNWHLLPYEQLTALLDLSPERLSHLLREDDFLWVKLGRLKPACEPLIWVEPTPAAKLRAAEVRAIVQRETAAVAGVKEEPRFAFLQHFYRRLPESAYPKEPVDPLSQPPRYLHSYFAVFGDPLLDSSLDPYPDALLKELAELGVTGVWLHVVLRDLAPGGEAFPEFGKDHEIRLKNLAALVARAKRFGIGIYLYMNEPRAMPKAFFANRPDVAGVAESDLLTMCTTRPEVRKWLSDSLAHVFRTVPDTAGVFTISASENLTSCASHGGHKKCPRCGSRSPADIIAEVNATIAEGVHRGSPKARVIVWDWGWQDAWAADAIAKLPKDVWFQSVSEWSLPIERGGVKTTVGEYSLSAVGPGPRATKHWQLARQAGLKTVAKCQFNNTWEISTVPSVPVLDLVAKHCRNLNAAGVDGYMLGWSLGGHPSPTLDLVRRFNQDPKASEDAVLTAVAQARYGPVGAGEARKAWTAFSDAFTNYPYHGSVVYRCPSQQGPSNLLWSKPTGYASTMVGIPYDDAKGWSGVYGPTILAQQFEKLSAGWQAGLASLEQAVAKSPPELKSAAEGDLRWARAVGIHLKSAANQTRFVLARDAAIAATQAHDAAAIKAAQAQATRYAEDEIRLSRELLRLSMEDSRLGFESSNHYFYVPQDLIEKIINCEWIVRGMGGSK